MNWVARGVERGDQRHSAYSRTDDLHYSENDSNNDHCVAFRVQVLDDRNPFQLFSSAVFDLAGMYICRLNAYIPLSVQLPNVLFALNAPFKAEECAIQLYKYNTMTGGEFAGYMDLDLSVAEQLDELKQQGLTDLNRGALILRTQLPIRVQTIIEKLSLATGRDLRRALFSLKQIFQDDKDLVHAFVRYGGLDCLVRLGSLATDENYQAYVLRALGQIMLYVDGMDGVMQHEQTVQWLYALLNSKHRVVRKNALKLLLVFVEYAESNCITMVRAVLAYHQLHGGQLWAAWFGVLHESDITDWETLLLAITLLNKVLLGLPDRATFLDVTDAVERLGMAQLVRHFAALNNTDLDFVQQLHVYEAALRQEDTQFQSVLSATANTLPAFAQLVRTQPRIANCDASRHSYRVNFREADLNSYTNDQFSSSTSRNTALNGVRNRTNATYASETTNDSANHSAFTVRLGAVENTNEVPSNGDHRSINLGRSADQTDGNLDESRTAKSRQEIKEMLSVVVTRSASRQRLPHRFAHPDRTVHDETASNAPSADGDSDQMAQPIFVQASRVDLVLVNVADDTAQDDKQGAAQTALKQRERPVSSAESAQVHIIPNSTEANPSSKPSDSKPLSTDPVLPKPKDTTFDRQFQPDPASDTLALSGVASASKQAAPLETAVIPPPPPPPPPLALLKSPTHAARSLSPLQRQNDAAGSNQASKRLDNVETTAVTASAATASDIPPDLDFSWDTAERQIRESRRLRVKDLDFTDLVEPVECTSVFTPLSSATLPPPPPLPPPAPPADSNSKSSKTRRTLKLHWRELKPGPAPPERTTQISNDPSVWEKLGKLNIKFDSTKFEVLFENRANELKRVAEPKSDLLGRKTLLILDAKRSNAINIGLTALPAPRLIKAAILKMDCGGISKENIEKILMTMLPTEEERAKILESQAENPDMPLGSAEQFLLMLSNIPEVRSRLELLLFKLDFENVEQEVAEPLMDLKFGIDDLSKSETFQYVLATLLAVGNFLNGSQSYAFSIDYLVKVPEVKDTVQKHTLLYHVCSVVLEQFPDSGDLYTEFSRITRCARVDWDELVRRIDKAERDCRSSWQALRNVCKADPDLEVRGKLVEFLRDASGRVLLLKLVYDSVLRKFRKCLCFFGYSRTMADECKIGPMCKILSDFALEYRTTREKVLQQLEKKKMARDRRKTRGKLIMDEDDSQSPGEQTSLANSSHIRVLPRQSTHAERQSGADADDEVSELKLLLSQNLTKARPKSTAETRGDKDKDRATAKLERSDSNNSSTLDDESSSTVKIAGWAANGRLLKDRAPRRAENTSGSPTTGAARDTPQKINDSDELEQDQDEALDAFVSQMIRNNARRRAPRNRQKLGTVRPSSEQHTARRTLESGLTDEERAAIAKYMKATE